MTEYRLCIYRVHDSNNPCLAEKLDEEREWIILHPVNLELESIRPQLVENIEILVGQRVL